MLGGLSQRWQIIPTWVKLAPVILLWAGLSLAHARLLDLGPTPWLATVQRLFFLPLVLAALLFGLRGGLAGAALVAINYYDPLIKAFNAPPGANLGHLLTEVGLYFLEGVAVGLIVDRERREAQRLKEAESLASLGQAAAAVAHELKTPLIAIGGFAQRMLRDLPPDHPHHRQLDIVVNQVGHMEQLLREMLDYSRPLELRLARLEFTPLLEECQALSAGMCEAQGVRVDLKPGPEVGMVLADPGRIKQVVLNLLQNAIQASPRGAVVRLEVQPLDGRLRLEVSDQGAGVAPEDRERIFHPFFTTKRHGTGLGLAICRKIVQAHGGELELVASVPGQGSTFGVCLPLERDLEVGRHPHRGEESEGA
jgi:signal transduction histidine kinase